MNTFLVCLGIFFARMLDVSIGTLRTIELVKEHTFKAVVLAFFEVFVWYLVARRALNTDILNILVAIFYAGGYATGTLVGSYLSRKLIKGSVAVQVISSKITHEEVEKIKSEGFGVSSLTLDNNKKMLIIEVNKRKTSDLIKIIKKYDEKAFITVSDTKFVANGFLN